MRPVSSHDCLPFERCPALWHATQVRRLDAGSRWSRIGAALHAACDAVTRAVLGEDGRPLYLVARAAVTAHAAEVDLSPDEMHEALDVMEGATAADSAISFYVPEGWTASADVDLLLDEAFHPVDGENAGLPYAYRGRIDRIEWGGDTGELEVWDWSGSHDYVSGADLLLDVRARWDAMLALAWFPAAHVVTSKRVMLRLGYTASAKFVRGDKWQGQIQDRAKRLAASTNAMLSAHREPGLLTGLPNGLPDMVIAGTRFPTRFGKWCGGCPVRGACETFERARVQGAALDVGVPRLDRALRLLALKAAVAELDEQLREDAAANGPIRLGDGTALGFHAKRAQTLRGGRDAVMDELRALGMTPDREREWFAPSDRAMPGLVREAVERLEKSRPMQAAIVERLLAPATGFNFEVKEVEDA